MIDIAHTLRCVPDLSGNNSGAKINRVGCDGMQWERASRTVSIVIFQLTTAAVLVTGAGLLFGGVMLAANRGSLLFGVEGALLLASGAMFIRRSSKAVDLLGVYTGVNIAWAIAEVGFDGWALLPRLDVATPLMLLAALPIVQRRLMPATPADAIRMYRITVAAVAALALTVAGAMVVAAWAGAHHPATAVTRLPMAGVVDEAWPAIGHDASGDRYSPLADVHVANVGKLVRVWDYQDDELARTSSEAGFSNRDEATPLEVNRRLYICLSDNSVLALDAETGRRLWRHDPHTDKTGVRVGICRGVAYFADPGSVACPRRILTATIDARLIAINAETGAPCPDFGDRGGVSLKSGLGDVKPGSYQATSPPTIAGDLAIVGALVKDNQSVGEPSGVVRAFSARTGALIWAWDVGRGPGASAADRTYTRGTPNAWSFFSVDEKLGMVYIPTGNATPDFVARHRSAGWEKYSSSVVALDLASGRVRWSFQTTHHDVWDYDVPAQPLLVDWPVPGRAVPALVQPTKRGELFVLDRRTGAPLSEVRERSAPATDLPGEWTAKTQPWSDGMPHLGGPPLREGDMWGLTPFDQLACRIAFRRLRYDGPFTPPSVGGSLISPGEAGGQNWGSATVDGARGLLITPTLRLAYVVRLEPRNVPPLAVDANPQLGSAYRAFVSPFLSRLHAPCQRPPYAVLSAVDLKSGQLAWERPLGLADRLGPMGLRSHLPLTLGAPPLIGGAISTAGGLVFIGAAGDNRLRAIRTDTGTELWSDRLPAGNQATPITYRAPRSGRQMVVMVSGGWVGLSVGQVSPTHVVAYALPDQRAD